MIDMKEEVKGSQMNEKWQQASELTFYTTR